MSTAVNSSLMASANPMDLEITIVCAKHLKNVNWRNGDLKPYVVFYLDSDYRLGTHSDESGSTRPVWNERFTLPVTRPVRQSVLTLEIFHSKVSETPKPLVGSVKFPLAHLVESDDSTQSIRKIELLRPSGRPQGKIRVKLVLKERPLPPPSLDYQAAPEYGNYYYPAPLPPFPSQYSDYSYYSGYHSAQPPAPPRPLYSRASNHSFSSGSVPSAPADFSSSQDYKQPPLPPPRTSSYGVPSGSGPSAPVDCSPYDQKLQKQFGGLSLDEEVNKRQRDKRAESEFAARDNYSYNDYHHDD